MQMAIPLYCQLDDVVTNTLGAAIGYLGFVLVR